MKQKFWILSFCFVALCGPSFGTIRVITTLPDFAWAAQQIGGSRVETKSLLKGTENPHFLDAVPEFIRLVSNADIVCIAGLELEIGYMPKILARSGNAQVQPGGKGYCELGTAVTTLEKPTSAIDRSMGDVHPFGNPHFWLGPKSFSEAVGVIAATLIRVDPAGAVQYQKGLADLRTRLNQVFESNLAQLKAKPALFQKPIAVEYHREFSYFFQNYGLMSLGSLEEKPGVAPSAGRLAEVARSAKEAGVLVALAAPYSPKPLMMKFQELSGVPVVTVGTSLQNNGKPDDFAVFQQKIIDAILGKK